MEKSELESVKNKESDEKLLEAFDRLQRIAGVLREMGFKVVDGMISLDRLKDPASIAQAFPS